MKSVIELLIAFVVVANITAFFGFLYFLVDRYVCLRDAYRLLRLLQTVEPKTYRYITGWSPFPWTFAPQRLIEFLSSFNLEEHNAIKQHKNSCRCWMEYYSTLGDYILRIGKIALLGSLVITTLLFLIGLLLLSRISAAF